MKRRVVCLVDALNQFERTPAARHLTWLPQLWPANARLIATTLPREEAAALERRPGVKVRLLPLLTELEAEQIAACVCKRHHQPVRPEVLQVLTSKQADGAPAAGNPLWLELAMEELLLLDADDFTRAQRDFSGTPEERLHQLRLEIAGKLPADIESLYGFLLQRTEEVQGEKWRWARAFADLIAVTRAGLRELDLQALLPKQAGEAADVWDPLRFASVRRSFRAHLVQRGALGQWDFFHAQTRAAVEHRSFGEPAVERALQARIVDHLESLPPGDALRDREMMFHVIRSGDASRAAILYASDLSEEALNHATRAIAEHLMMDVLALADERRQWVDSLLSQPGISDEQRVLLADRYIFQIIGRHGDGFDVRIRLALLENLERVLSELIRRSPQNCDWQWELAFVHGRLSDALLASYKLDEALAQQDKATAIMQRLTALDPARTAWQRDLSAGLVKASYILMRQGKVARAIDIYRQRLAALEELASRESDPDQLYQLKGDISQVHRAISYALFEQGEIVGSVQEGLLQLESLEQMGKPSSSGDRLYTVQWCLTSLLESHIWLAQLFHHMGEAARADEEFRLARQALVRLREFDVDDRAWKSESLFSIRQAQVLAARGDRHGAVEACRLNLPMPLMMETPPTLQGRLELAENIGAAADVMKDVNEIDLALAAYARSIELAEPVLRQSPSDVQRATFLQGLYAYVGDCWSKRGDSDKAIEQYRKALLTLAPLKPETSQDAVVRFDLAGCLLRLGEELWTRGEVGEARAEYLRAADLLDAPMLLEKSRVLLLGLNLVRARCRTAYGLHACGETARAERLFHLALDAVHPQSSSVVESEEWQREIANVRKGLADLLRDRGDKPVAAARYQEVIPMIHALLAKKPDDVQSA